LQQIAPKDTMVNSKFCKNMVDHAAEDEVSPSKICCSNEAIFHLCWRDVNTHRTSVYGT